MPMTDILRIVPGGPTALTGGPAALPGGATAQPGGATALTGGTTALTGGPGGPTGNAAPAPRFQQLLERMQRLAREHQAAPPVEDADQLQAALRTADDGFVAAMDLRQKLEEAFRRHQS